MTRRGSWNIEFPHGISLQLSKRGLWDLIPSPRPPPQSISFQTTAFAKPLQLRKKTGKSHPDYGSVLWANQNNGNTKRGLETTVVLGAPDAPHGGYSTAQQNSNAKPFRTKFKPRMLQETKKRTGKSRRWYVALPPPLKTGEVNSCNMLSSMK